MGLAALSTALGGLLWLAAEPVVAAYTDDPAVRRTVALGLIAYIAVYQFFDAPADGGGPRLAGLSRDFSAHGGPDLLFWGWGAGGRLVALLPLGTALGVGASGLPRWQT